MAQRLAVATEAAAEQRPSNELPGFSMQQQEHDHWCWAAVATSLARFYDSATKWKEQCTVANAHLQRSDCCSAAAAEECNVARIMEEVLQTVGLFREWHIGPKPFDAVCEAIDDNRAIVCRIVWSGDGGHFVVITGYDRGRETIVVHDPFFQRSDVPFTTF
jgi:ABC-type bacteriocin/lantibiotic exporter with double-glycine peptidase domain